MGQCLHTMRGAGPSPCSGSGAGLSICRPLGGVQRLPDAPKPLPSIGCCHVVRSGPGRQRCRARQESRSWLSPLGPMIRGQKRRANKGIVLRWWMFHNVQLNIVICIVSGQMNATKYLFCCVHNSVGNQCHGLGPGGYNPPGPGPFLMFNPTIPSRTPPPG